MYSHWEWEWAYECGVLGYGYPVQFDGHFFVSAGDHPFGKSIRKRGN
ncbi:hypothetical protein [Paenibacillus motobuensis]|uniref:Uncharacterized protein n=1 Tax=Paenibacillus motobuensis TaxID=295324 RepID=A0ABP3I3P5_9BACL